MKEVHSRFDGERGTFAHFGDSITVTLAFWTPLLYERNNASEEMKEAFNLVKDHLKAECWRQWKGPEYGNEGSMTIRWAHENIDIRLKRLNPETALILFGTNDLSSVPLEEYKEKLGYVVQKCLDNGTVVILTTIPPRHGFYERSLLYAEAIRRVAREKKVPLIDFQAEILSRRSDDWNGAMEKYDAYQGYDVPTLLARDGVHPSNPKMFQDDYSPEGLANSGYVLRNYLTLMKYAEVLSALATDPVNGEPSMQNLIEQDWFPKALPLPKSGGPVLRVSTTAQLTKAVDAIAPGGTILLEDGHYLMPHYIMIQTDRVTLRSASGNRENVIIDGNQSRDGELIGFSCCKGVTVADLTIQNCQWNGFKINSETGVQDLTIYNCVIHNIWQRGVKGVKVPLTDREKIRPKNCRISYCLFYNDRPKRFTDDPADTAQNFNGDYVAGIDVMFANRWIISDNVFVGIQGRTRQGRGAIFIWHDSRDCIIERNIIIDCDAGVCLGNPHRSEDIKIHCTNCIVRNNFITRGPQAGIVAVYTKNCKLLNNTIYEPLSRLGRLIRVVFDNEGLYIANNLLCGPDIRIESQSRIRRVDNLAKDISSFLVRPGHGDLHLSTPAGEIIDHALSFGEVKDDIDSQPRSGKPDIGADEYTP
ncbi:MAG: right-handed parallel beta-helix repeat-containing protein [Sedimentisphaerales bacterium]|nr:right-handed parallel beta-helix repeat-containing protein [Sedimentisphaerales bacterium]